MSLSHISADPASDALLRRTLSARCLIVQRRGEQRVSMQAKTCKSLTSQSTVHGLRYVLYPFIQQDACFRFAWAFLDKCWLCKRKCHYIL